MSGKLLVALGSDSALKLSAARAAVRRVCPQGIEVVPCQAASGVPPQPVGAETFRGAWNRAQGALRACPEASLGLGIESGVEILKLFEVDGGEIVADVALDAGVVCLARREDVPSRATWTLSGALPLHASYVARSALSGMGVTAGELMAEDHDWVAYDWHSGMTGGHAGREALLEQAVAAALAIRLGLRVVREDWSGYAISGEGGGLVSTPLATPEALLGAYARVLEDRPLWEDERASLARLLRRLSGDAVLATAVERLRCACGPIACRRCGSEMTSRHPEPAACGICGELTAPSLNGPVGILDDLVQKPLVQDALSDGPEDAEGWREEPLPAEKSVWIVSATGARVTVEDTGTGTIRWSASDGERGFTLPSTWNRNVREGALRLERPESGGAS